MGESKVVVMTVVCWWVCGCVNEVYIEVTGCGGGCVSRGVGGWVSEFLDKWHSLYANNHYAHSTMCLTYFCLRVD